MNNWQSLSALDQIRVRQGAMRLRQIFRGLARRNRQEALLYINDEKLQFPTLYILMPEIEALDLYKDLNQRNIVALTNCAKILDDEALGSCVMPFAPQDDDTGRQSLQWMFKTGAKWQGAEKDAAYDAIIDGVVAVLTRIHKDKTVLPEVSELIFKRNRQGYFIHDLVWGFFQAFDPEALKLVAKYLLSANAKDVELACKLLHLPIPQEAGRGEEKRKMYEDYLAWLEENNPFLFFTKEHFHLTSDPNPVEVDLAAKYVCKRISPQNKKLLEPLSDEEQRSIQVFKKIPPQEQKALSDYSYKIHQEDPSLWHQWLRKQLGEQIKIADADTEEV